MVSSKNLPCSVTLFLFNTAIGGWWNAQIFWLEARRKVEDGGALEVLGRVYDQFIRIPEIFRQFGQTWARRLDESGIEPSEGCDYSMNLRSHDFMSSGF